MLKTRADRIAVGVLVVLVSVWVSPFFVRVLALGPFAATGRWIDAWPARPMARLGTDAQNHYTHLALDRVSIVRYGQFPWRTHLVGGGVYLLGHPRDVTLSPVFLPVLLFGEAWGLKVSTAAVYFAAALGMYYLCRVCLGFGPLGSFYAGALLVVAAWLPARLYTGCFDEWHFMLFPLILALFKQARRNWRSGIGAAMLLYVVMVDGKYILPALCLYLALFAMAETAQHLWRRSRRWWEPAPRLAGIVLLVALLGVVKILPMMSILRVDDRTRTDRYTERHVAWDWLMLPEKLGAYIDDAVVEVPPAALRVRCVGAGAMALLLALMGFARHPRRLAGWMLLMILGIWLTLWRNMPLDLFRPLSHLPLFRSIKQPLRFFNWTLLFCLCVMGGRLISTVAGSRKRFWPVLAAIGLAVGGLEQPLLGNFFIQTNIFTDPAVPVRWRRDFRPVVATDPSKKQHRQWRDHVYIRRNIGVINWYCPLDLPRAAEPMRFIDEVGRSTPNPAYRGEAFFRLPGNRAEVTELTPNRIRVEVAVEMPDTLVVNQNYDPRWRTDAGAITSLRMDTPAHLLVGLDEKWVSSVKYDRTHREFRRLAVRLDEPGRYTVTLRYRPLDAYLGATVSAVTWAACLIVLVVGTSRRRARRRAHTTNRKGRKGREAETEEEGSR